VQLPVAGGTRPAPADPEEAILQRSIQMEEVDSDVFIAAKEDLWKPPGQPGVFGGQTLSQSLHAALLTIEEGLVVHSFHGYFLMAGDTARNIVFHVRRMRDGKSFATRLVEARQRGQVIFISTIQFHRPEPSNGLEVAAEMPNVAGPDGLTSNRDVLLQLLADDPRNSERMRKRWQQELAAPTRAERRMAPAPEGSDPSDPVEFHWTRATGRLSDDREIHLVCLAYMSDYDMLLSAYRPWGGIYANRPSMMVSLDHSMWFHSMDFRADEWLLFQIRCVRAGGARILAFTRVWTQGGDLIFTCAQEGLARHAEPLPPPRKSPMALSAKL